MIAFITLLIVYGAICLAAFLYQRKLIYFPNRVMIEDPAASGLPFEEFKLSSADTTSFCVWRFQHPANKAAVVFFHGNAENISNAIDLYRRWFNLGVTVYAFEFRGYLNTVGEPSEKAIEQDLHVFADSLKKWHAGKRMKFISLGRSLGGAIAAKFASIYPVDGLILEASFSSMSDIAQHRFPILPARLLLTECYNTAKILEKLTVPVMIIHSPDDDIVPFFLGRKLYNSANEPKELVAISGSHNGYTAQSEEQLSKSYSAFLDRILRQR